MLQPGDQIDIWVVENALGAGGMGSVYRCHNRSATRILAAVKVLESTLRHVPGAEERFIREAEILFSLDHPNIVKVRNVRTDTDPPYLEMEFVEGKSLETMLRTGALPYPDALSVMRQLTDALAYLHERGVRHRDVKPANLLVNEEGRLTLVDFGLAMEADQTRLTQSNTTFGTVSYAPPEWIKPESMDPEKWDLYASGVVFWEMLRGQVAFPVSGKGSARQQAMQVIIAKQDHPPLDPGPDFHDDVRELIKDLTRAHPELRPRNMAEARDRVKDLIPRTKRTAGQTIAPLHPWELEDRSTWVDPTGAPPIRDEWAKVLEATPIPAEPRDESSEAETVVRQSLLALGTGRSTLFLAFGSTVVVVVLGLAAILVGWAVLGEHARQGPPLRAVDAVVSGVTPGTEVGLKIGDQPARSRVSWVYRFGEIPVGDATLSWVIGGDCSLKACPGSECPAWCGTGTREIQVTIGEGTQTIPVPLDPPPQRTVEVSLPEDLRDRWPVRVVLGSAEGVVAEGGKADIEGIAPGRHALRVDVGDCGPRDRGCHPEGECPPGCISWETELVVPWGEGVLAVPAEVEAPASPPAKPVAARPTPTPAAIAEPPAQHPEPKPVETPPIPAAAAQAPVTNASFATWLAAHPDWHREAAIAAGLADENYLSGWTGASPPAGTGAQAVTNVSWYAAAAYCKERGGLAGVDAEPLAWEESPTQPYLEWRSDGGRAAWRGSDGRKSNQAGLNKANSFTGFRCAG